MPQSVVCEFLQFSQDVCGDAGLTLGQHGVLFSNEHKDRKH